MEQLVLIHGATTTSTQRTTTVPQQQLMILSDVVIYAMLTMREGDFLKNTRRSLLMVMKPYCLISPRIGRTQEGLCQWRQLLLNALVSCDGSGYDWSDQAEEGPTNLKLYASKPDLSFSGLKEFTSEPIVIKPIVENSEAKASEAKPKAIRKNNDAPIIKDWVSDSEEENVSQTKIEFVKPKGKTARKTAKQVEQLRQNTHTPRGNQRNWYNMMSQRLGRNISCWETEAKDSEVCKITRADGSSRFHGDIQALLRRLDRQDLRQLYSLVQERFKDHPLEGHDLDYGEFRLIFDPNCKDDDIWLNQ
ncbi:hypothetical protein Tco_0774213 [Tanacetum coccineum]|uniref:Uncharacterized protein n=1 Tax=Tanacetum coccineum TaxID=301880 RepID=A0ABQ4ZNU9_9ASTR